MSKDGFGWSTKMTRYRKKKSTTRGVDQIEVSPIRVIFLSKSLNIMSMSMIMFDHYAKDSF